MKKKFLNYIKSILTINNQYEEEVFSILEKHIENKCNSLEEFENFMQGDYNIRNIITKDKTKEIFEKYYKEIFEILNEDKELTGLEIELNYEWLVYASFESLISLRWMPDLDGQLLLNIKSLKELINKSINLKDLNTKLIDMDYEDIYNYDIQNIINNECISIKLDMYNYIEINFKIIGDNKENPIIKIINVEII